MIPSACSPALPTEARTVPFALGVHMRRSSRYLGNDEPSLDELLADDDVLRRVMARDGVEPESLLALAHHLRDRD
ncbi:hypothetical protein [Magnetospirillum sp. UT-4]|uniref:hypothetical protein n=1 Tax=Magnetospirillum sp. UT-4 TaxID=2681467 RepID=UPI001384849D|nr:hypothetical protein [Magnetospirillum sp. UT-4]CAA7624529.1 conserved hypothetical protein [Magnetospirillum sp. UT-4]